MYRILIAEDDPHIMRLISLWLSRQGYEVLEARNGLSALELYESTHPDALVVDVNMPKMSGLELIERVLQGGQCPSGIVVLTSRCDHAEIRERLEHLGVHLMPKPFSPMKLARLIESLLQQREPSVAGVRCSE